MEQNNMLILGLYAAGLAVAGLLYAYHLGKAGEKRHCALIAMILGLPLAYAGAKLFFLLHNIGMDIRNWSAETLFQLRWEELSFSGGCLGFVLGVWIAARIMRIPGKKALDLFAVPGCILIAFARMAEAGMETIGQGDMPSFLPEVFPFALTDDWGSMLAVFTLEALAALLCALWLTLTRNKAERPGMVFGKACMVLCCAQLFLEMLVVNYWIPFIISFIHLDQVICAVVALVLIVRWSLRNKKAGPVIVTVLLIGLNALMQFVQDKPYLFHLPEEMDAGALALVVFALCSAGMIAAGLWAAGKDHSASVAPSDSVAPGPKNELSTKGS